MKNNFSKNQSLREFQQFINDVYSTPDDRFYSIWDLLTHVQRFAMRALKGIRKGSAERLKSNLLISFAWLMAAANRLHIDVEDDVWRRFPAFCSYCGGAPCVCKKIKPTKRAQIAVDKSIRPKTLAEYQEMFQKIYPSSDRTLADAGVHLAEETGEVSEAIHNFLGQHMESQFDEIQFEVADFISCFFGVANSANIDVAEELSQMFSENCHVCHKSPCACTFSEVTEIKT